MQLKLNLNKGKWGGRRSRSGRKRIHSRGVSHREREKISSRTPMHVNFKYSVSIRNKDALKLLKRSIHNARSHGLRILHFSLQHNHIHLIVEADSNELLSRGMRSLTITFAKGLRKGRVQIERYHLHVLKTIKETQNAIHYVLFNQQRHDRGTCTTIDHYSSILSLKDGLKLIQKFACDNKVTIKIENGLWWKPDSPKSFFAQTGLLKNF